MSKPLSLNELNEEIKKALSENLAISYWIAGEINSCKVNASGHCYLELVQKDENTERIIARNKAIIWAGNYRMIKAYFETTTRQPFDTGISIMVKVNVEYHEIYGLSLNIFDIEPVYTVGELEIKKKKILEQLANEGILTMNKEVEFPYLPKTIAVISSKTAAGYGDFKDQLLKNIHGFRFNIQLFPAIVQGNEAEQSVTMALDKIYRHESIFDCVVIIRGGGSQSDLNCFNNYHIASHVAQFPLPVITGIGHEQDDTITDIVAHTRLKTPTAVAEFLINIYMERQQEIHEMKDAVFHYFENKIRLEKQLIARYASGIIQHTKTKFNNAKTSIELMNARIHHSKNQYYQRQISKIISAGIHIEKIIGKKVTKHKLKLVKMNDMVRHITGEKITGEKYSLEIFGNTINNLNPSAVLNRGYSITLKDGKAIKTSQQVTKDDSVETILSKGKIISTITDKK